MSEISSLRVKLILVVFALLATFNVGFALPPSSGQIEHLTAILGIDNSGSMKDSDPAELRFTGARLFVALSDVGDSLGLLTFSTGSQALTDGLLTITGEAKKYTLLSLLINPPAPGGYTDIKAALEQTAGMLASHSAPIILLTDGKPEIPNPYPEYEQETLELARSLGVPIIAIALTPAAQTPFLERLAAGTGGRVVPAEDAGDLLDAYLDVFSQIKDRTIVGEGETSAPDEAHLYLDPGLTPFIEKASFLVVKPAGVDATLIAPDGTPVLPETPGVIFHLTTDPDFMLVTVARPQGGDWTFRLDGSGNCLARAILRSRLRLEITSPTAYHQAGTALPVVARLLEEEQSGQMTRIIGDASFSARITLPDGSHDSLDRFYDDGTHGDQQAGDGDFTRLYVNTGQVGQYRLQVEGRKGAVPVEGSTRFETISFPSIEIDGPFGLQTVQAEPVILKVHLQGGDRGGLDQGQFLARVLNPQGGEQRIPLVADGITYSAWFYPRVEGTHHVYFESQSATYHGLPYQGSAETTFDVDILRTLQVGLPEIQTPSCFEREFKLNAELHVTTTGKESITIKAEAGESFQASSQKLTLEPGATQALLFLAAQNSLIPGGEYQGLLTVAAHPGLDVLPGRQIPFQFVVPSPLARCRRELGLGSSVFLFLSLGVLLTVRRARAVAAPPLMTGTLRYWLTDAEPGQAREFDLTALERTEMVIGANETCDLALPGLASRHAILQAVKTETGIRVLLEPLDEIRKGYGTLHASHTLEHGDRLRMGNYEIQYLSDTGV